jgi:hypothetical protein
MVLEIRPEDRQVDPRGLNSQMILQHILINELFEVTSLFEGGVDMGSGRTEQAVKRQDLHDFQ